MLGILVTYLLLAPPEARTLELNREFQGVRSAAMGGAHRGVGTSNDTIALNPAGLAIAQRYSIDLNYAFTPLDGISHFNVSFLDSKTAPLAAALQYTFDMGNKNNADIALHRAYLALAYPLASFLSFGSVSRYVYGKYSDTTLKNHSVGEFSTDLGLSMLFGQMVGLGFTYHNLIHERGALLTRPALGLGLSLSLGNLVLAGDTRMDLDHKQGKYLTHHAGAEYFLKKVMAFRAGYLRQSYIEDALVKPEDSITSGIGLVDSIGALDVTYTQSLQRSNNWGLIAALKLYL